MVSSRHLYYCLAFRNAKYYPGNQYQLFNSCIIGNCSNCYSLQYYFRQKAFRLTRKVIEKFKKLNRIIQLFLCQNFKIDLIHIHKLLLKAQISI